MLHSIEIGACLVAQQVAYWHMVQQGLGEISYPYQMRLCAP